MSNDESFSLTMRDLCYLYYLAYHAGHEDTVESRYTDVLPADANSYHEDAVKDCLSEILGDPRTPEYGVGS